MVRGTLVKRAGIRTTSMRRGRSRRLELEPLEDRTLLSFGAPITYDVGTDPQNMVVADLNGDGRLDFATANFNSNNVTVWMGTAAGDFQAGGTFAVGTNPMSLQIADTDHTGYLDLAIAHMRGRKRAGPRRLARGRRCPRTTGRQPRRRVPIDGQALKSRSTDPLARPSRQAQPGEPLLPI